MLTSKNYLGKEPRNSAYVVTYTEYDEAEKEIYTNSCIKNTQKDAAHQAYLYYKVHLESLLSAFNIIEHTQVCDDWLLGENVEAYFDNENQILESKEFAMTLADSHLYKRVAKITVKRDVID